MYSQYIIASDVTKSSSKFNGQCNEQSFAVRQRFFSCISLGFVRFKSIPQCFKHNALCSCSKGAGLMSVIKSEDLPSDIFKISYPRLCGSFVCHFNSLEIIQSCSHFGVAHIYCHHYPTMCTIYIVLSEFAMV